MDFPGSICFFGIFHFVTIGRSNVLTPSKNRTLSLTGMLPASPARESGEASLRHPRNTWQYNRLLIEDAEMTFNNHNHRGCYALMLKTPFLRKRAGFFAFISFSNIVMEAENRLHVFMRLSDSKRPDIHRPFTIYAIKALCSRTASLKECFTWGKSCCQLTSRP